MSLAVGTHAVTATFTPADSAAFTASTSAAVSYVVSAVPVEPVFEPAIRVFLADGVTPYAGQPVYTDDVLVVKGTGFDPASNVGGRGVPIPNTLPQGTYAVFGSFLDAWQPSTKAPSSARATTDTKWALAASVLDQVPPAFQGMIRAQWAELAADGSFSTTLTAKDFGKALPEGSWGVYTYGAGGVANAAQELSVKINYVGDKPTPVAPKVTVSPAADLDPAVENTLTVSGTGFTGPGAANGAYVLFGETSVWSGGSPLPADGWIDQAWVPAASVTDGAFTTTLTIPAGTLDPAKSYQVATSAAHGLSVTNRTLDTFTPVTVAEPAAGPAIVVGGDLVAGGTVTVRGTGFPAETPVTVEVHSEVVTLGTTTTTAADGTFSVTGTLPATLQPGEHTVIARAGEVTAERPITVGLAPAPKPEPVVEQPAAPTCVARSVSGATISWNVKESFRSYVQGPIAKGSYSIDWGTGSGAYNTTDDRGRVSFGGSAHFTGHGGILDLTLSNPRIQVNSATSATLYVSTSSTGTVALANLSLPQANRSASEISWDGVGATLTAAGARLFSYNGNAFYPAGTALDPVSFSFPLGADVACDDTTSNELAATGGSTPDATVWLGLGMLVLGAGLVAMRRRKVLATR